MNTSILVVPDVHGRSFWRKILNSDLPVVFLGDYVDPYEHEGIDYNQALKEFSDIIEFAKERPDDVTLLIGNHDAHYVGLSYDLARLNVGHAWYLHELYKKNEVLFTGAYRANNALFTHAGVRKSWLDLHRISEDPEIVVNYINSKIKFEDRAIIPSYYETGNSSSPIGDIGSARGGYAPFGGPLWCDITEIYSDSAFKDQITQIFGHTQLKETGSFIHDNNIYCCDSREVFIWDGKVLEKFCS
jgi:hypothetical protein